jgi:hypothetical protein
MHREPSRADVLTASNKRQRERTPRFDVVRARREDRRGRVGDRSRRVSAQRGVAVDPAAGGIYWASFLGKRISFASRDGSGGGDLTTTGATSNRPVFPILLQAPSGVGVPLVSGATVAGATLSCSQGA